MKVLILTVTAGFGHHASAKALEEAFLERGVIAKTIDIYKEINKMLYNTVDKGYLFTTKYTTALYRKSYELADKKKNDENVVSVPQIVGAIYYQKSAKIIEEFAPDAIICTHIFAAQVANQFKRRSKSSIPVAGIVTDYTIHPFWQDVRNIEYIITASEFLTLRALRKGISADKIVPLGIPINPKFSAGGNRAEARKMLGIDDKKTILVMAGSMGYGNIVSIVSRLEDTEGDTQILTVCGNNKNQYRKILKFKLGDPEKYKNIHVYGFVDNVDVFMDAADCIVTKPGGLTISEAMAKSLPMILTDPIPGQEERNIEFLMNNGAAILATETFPLEEAVYTITNNPSRLKLMRESIESISHKNATRDIVDFIVKIGNKRDAGKA